MKLRTFMCLVAALFALTMFAFTIFGQVTQDEERVLE